MSNPNPIRVLVVDEHPMVRRGLTTFLKTEEDMVLAGEASSGHEAIDLCAELNPDVILMDLVMPEMSGAETTKIIRGRWPDIQVIALTSFQEKDLVQQALQAGAIGYLLKNVSAAELAEAIRAAYAGQATLAPEAARVLIQSAQAGPEIGSDLTDRERQVLSLMAQGLNNPQIAQRLTISHSTARAHVSNILAKLGVSNRTEAIALALRHKLVT